MADVDAGEWALRICISLVTVLTRRDPTLASEVATDLESYLPLAPNDEAREALLAAISVARYGGHPVRL